MTTFGKSLAAGKTYGSRRNSSTGWWDSLLDSSDSVSSKDPQLSAFGREGKCRTFRKSRSSLGSSSFSKMTACKYISRPCRRCSKTFGTQFLTCLDGISGVLIHFLSFLCKAWNSLYLFSTKCFLPFISTSILNTYTGKKNLKD